jgi:hypothetical protein
MSVTRGELEFGFWFVFGEHATGRVDVVDENGDIINRVSRELADRICDSHNATVALIDEALKEGAVLND